MIGISSYLLINFWYTRIQANKAAILALTMNRVGDMALSIGFFAILWMFGNLDYATIFSIAPYMNETAITIIGILLLMAAMGKSAQIGLHTWLPGSMEGWIIISFIILIVLDNSNLYLDLNIKQSLLPSILLSIPKETLHVITGNMLGDGSIQYKKVLSNGKVIGNAKYAMTLDSYSLNYLNHLYETVYKQFSLSGIRPYPNILLPQHLDKVVTQYSFNTRSLPIFTYMHSLWYYWDKNNNRYVKRVPLNISEVFSIVSLAYWIMDDGYFDSYGRTQTLLLCTESFTKLECELLQSVLSSLEIKSTLKIRNKEKSTYRIRISKTSMTLVRNLVTPYIHKDFLYKLG